MKPVIFFRMIIVCVAFSILVLSGSHGEASGDANAPHEDSPEFPTYVMNRIDDQYRGDRSHGIMSMEVKTKHWTRTIKMESWSLGKEYSLVRILKPKKEKGTSTLKAKNDLFTYLSKTGKTIKITSGMMGGAWMGSHFTNDDLVKHSRLSEDYNITLTFKGDENGQQVYQFTLIPKPDSPVVWGKTVATVRQNDMQPLRQDFYDEDGNKVRRLEYSNHVKKSGRVMPTKMMMTPLNKPGEYTLIICEKVDFGIELKKSFFSIQRLKSL
jgi:hypothetical protein